MQSWQKHDEHAKIICIISTTICSVSMLGKHMRKDANILESLRTPKRTFNPRILMPGTMVLGVAFIPA
jgi:hypothetical protein